MADIKTIIKRRWRIIAFGAIVIASFWVAIWRFGWGWTGFVEYTGQLPKDERAKTLWDFLELLIVPALLGFGALLFNKALRDNEQRRTIEQQREEALQNYLDKMEDLLLEEKLLENMDYPGEAVVKVAQTRTITTLRILDKDRRSILFQFLRDSNLADFILVTASLVEIDLSETRISRINLAGADLRWANLFEANLFEADLTGATLHGANLRRAFLWGANLGGANLVKANLERANLMGATVTSEQLAQTKSLEGATMPDGTKHE